MKAQEYLEFQTHRSVKLMYKRFLEVLEDLKHQHDSNYFKIMNSVPNEYKSLIIQGDYLDDKSFDFYRKKILDAGNECNRHLASELLKLDINFKSDTLS